MNHRVNFYHEQLMEHLTQREWTDEDKSHFLHMVGRSALMSEQGVLAVLEFQQATDERIEGEKAFDEAFVPGIPQDFFEPHLPFTEPQVADAGWDESGNYHTFIPGSEA